MRMSFNRIFQDLLKVPSRALAGRSLVWVPQPYNSRCTTHLLFSGNNVVGRVGAFDQGPERIHWFYQADLSKQGVGATFARDGKKAKGEQGACCWEFADSREVWLPKRQHIWLEHPEHRGNFIV